MKLALVFPRMIHPSGDPPLGIAYIAAYVKKHTNSQVSIIDTTFHPSFEYVKEQLEKLKPEMVGISTDTLMYNNTVKIAKIAKDLGIIVAIGGPHASILPETLKDYADIIVIGEGEETFKELVESFENKKKDFSKIKGIWYKKNGVWWKNIARKPIENLNQFEFPAFHMLEMNKYFDLWHSLDCINPKLKGTNIVASRGCPYNCSYCQPTLRKIFGNKYRIRSPENVVAELKELKKRYEINTFFLHDDTFTIYKDWVKKFCDLLKKEKLKFLWSCNSRINNLKDKEMLKFMHESGLRMIHIGIESGSQRILDEIYNKGINISDVQKVIDSAKDIGIKTLAFFMLGAPGETEKEIKQTIKFAVSLNATEITATITTPLPGTKLYDMIKDKYKISDNFSDFDYYNKRAFEDPKLPYNKLKRYQRELLFRFYIHPKRWGYILKHLITLKGWKKMILKVKRFL